MKNFIQTSYFVLSGTILVLVGSYIALIPTTYLANFGLAATQPFDILNELRGMGGTLLVFGLFICVSIFNKNMRPQAALMATLIFASFSFFRLMGMLIDGQPNSGIMLAWSIEIVLLIGSLVILRTKNLK